MVDKSRKELEDTMTLILNGKGYSTSGAARVVAECKKKDDLALVEYVINDIEYTKVVREKSEVARRVKEAANVFYSAFVNFHLIDPRDIFDERMQEYNRCFKDLCRKFDEIKGFVATAQGKMELLVIRPPVSGNGIDGEATADKPAGQPVEAPSKASP